MVHALARFRRLTFIVLFRDLLNRLKTQAQDAGPEVEWTWSLSTENTRKNLEQDASGPEEKTS